MRTIPAGIRPHRRLALAVGVISLVIAVFREDPVLRDAPPRVSPRFHARGVPI